MAEPTAITCTSACTVTVVHELSLPPFQLDTTQGAQIAVAVMLVWAAAFTFRILIRTLRVDEKPTAADD